MPSDAVFTTQHGDTLRWEISKSNTDVAYGKSDYEDGLIMIVPSLDHEITLDMNYFMNKNKYIREIDIISPAQAY
ncbi:hypothetical protein J2S19_001556 [Metabacillus malikii]|uniref:Uncharacterized protein n=1 Tax=Metabacillus malikii TaxID=1504265 RepID=A0ABT9ZEM7_9BACI|nr:hypothetical protein [Metabacillus malikii]